MQYPSLGSRYNAVEKRCQRDNEQMRLGHDAQRTLGKCDAPIFDHVISDIQSDRSQVSGETSHDQDQQQHTE